MATGIWSELRPVQVSVTEDFLADEVAELEAEGALIAAYPTPTRSGAAIRPSHFARAIREARQRLRPSRASREDRCVGIVAAPVCSASCRTASSPASPIRASASLPVGWHLAGVMTRDVGSKWSDTIEPSGEDEWVALAVETKRSSFAIGSGTYPEQALTDLADKLRGVGGDPNG